jgi:uncharacterized membrane protein YhaH (DUF805 family)
MHWYLDVLKKYAVFNGRARRKEFWMFSLFDLIIRCFLLLIGWIVGDPGILNILYTLAVLIPQIAVSVRRLHDTDRSGWWLLMALVPLIGAIVVLVFDVQDSTPGKNQYGENPKERRHPISERETSHPMTERETLHPMFCTFCGTPNEAGDSFCAKCGKPLTPISEREVLHPLTEKEISHPMVEKEISKPMIKKETLGARGPVQNTVRERETFRGKGLTQNAVAEKRTLRARGPTQRMTLQAKETMSTGTKILIAMGGVVIILLLVIVGLSTEKGKALLSKGADAKLSGKLVSSTATDNSAESGISTRMNQIKTVVVEIATPSDDGVLIRTEDGEFFLHIENPMGKEIFELLQESRERKSPVIITYEEDGLIENVKPAISG